MAETTCGFFVVCMPCLPKIFRETGVTRKIKKAFGMSVTPTGQKDSNYPSYGYPAKYGTGVSGLSRSTATADAYHKLNEDGSVAMGDMKTESTEQLRQDAGKDRIMRTTQVTVDVTGDGTDSEGPRQPGKSSKTRTVDNDSYYH